MASRTNDDFPAMPAAERTTESASLASTAPSTFSPSRRLASIDAYRGLVMFLLMAEVLRFCAVSAAIPESALWKLLCHHQQHVEWTGCALHDLIQPSFSFLVGVALPFSIASRLAKGQSRGRMTAHAFWRALILVFLGVFLRSINRSQTNFTFEDTLSQIGLGYGFLFLLAFRPPRDQWIAFGAILVGYWALFALYPVPSPFDYQSVGVPKDWPYLSDGFLAHWNKNSNPAWRFDTWFLNLFPREKPFLYNGGNYSTINFIPTLATMILGLLAGELLRSDRPGWSKVGLMVVGGLIGLASGWGLDALGVCPLVKKIWTPSWVLFSGGWALIFLALFHATADLLKLGPLFYPLRVIGANSIAAYCITETMRGFIGSNLNTHLGSNAFKVFGAAYAPAVEGAAIILVMWLILFWMDRRKIYLRI
jgi:predicted acyltransferase